MSATIIVNPVSDTGDLSDAFVDRKGAYLGAGAGAVFGSMAAEAFKREGDPLIIAGFAMLGSLIGNMIGNKPPAPTP